MFQEEFHLSDRDLLLWADGELASQRAAKTRRHLSACWTCRARLAEMEHAIADFVQIYGSELQADLPPIEGPRALLAAILLSIAVAMRISLHENYTVAQIGAIPNVHLTPGATNPIGIQDVCSANVAANDPAVPDPLRREVLKEYGLKDAPANAYEIDYLVTPQLGGAADIRNLWPQPSMHTVWNARVKDALENRLHFLVCSGQLDLATAQREISQDWVAAYKKYFRTNAPLQEHAMPKAIGMRRRDVPFPFGALRG